MSKSCELCHNSMSAGTRQHHSSVIKSPPHVLERYALNKKGDVGSLYDAWTDNVLSNLSVHHNFVSKETVEEAPQCKLFNEEAVDHDDYLQLINIEDDLWISIALDMTSIAEGTAILYQYKPHVDRHVYFLYYRRVDRHVQLAEDFEIVSYALSKCLPSTKATHIITSVKQGIDFIIAVEFSYKENSHQIKALLQKISDYFTKRGVEYVTPKEQEIINHFTLEIFTQIDEIRSLQKSKKPNETFQYIHQYIFQDKHHFPLSYTLHPVRCLCLNDSDNGGIFLPLEQLVITKIASIIFGLFNKMKTAEGLLDDIRSLQLSQHLQTDSDRGLEKLTELKAIYKTIQNQLSNKVLKYRRETNNYPSFEKELKNLQHKALNAELDTLYDGLSKLKNQAHDLKQSNRSISKTSSIESKELNILLLGETGVGKSTFINAFVNYLAFESIEKVEKTGPIVLIPVSFPMTNDDQSGEYEIKLGKENNSYEDFNHPGRTITQQCQSYLFDLGQNTKLRLIDTPGIGDTRGLSQDDKNIQSILSYVNHLSHLNGVCILLKPNTSRVHVLFRSCLEQIFDFLGPNAKENIIFCFTSSRSTFFLPGNTAPLLKKMLNDLPADHTPQLSKANMFCFDSESFRYLAALKSQTGIEFKDDQKADFHMCWDKSVAESIRLIRLIKSRPPYAMNTWHSTKHAQTIIISFIRPILETIRHLLRNRILNDIEKKPYSLELEVESLSRPSYLCTTCPFESSQPNIFPMVNHSVHRYSKANECDRCHCEYNKHFPILYKLKYGLCDTQNSPSSSKTKNMRDHLLQQSVRFAYFLLHTVRIEEDPFLPWLDLFIREEFYLCSQKPLNNLNKNLHTELVELKDAYQKQLDEVKHEQEQTNIDEIYEWMEKMQSFPMINKQMNMIRESQMKMLQYYTHDVSSEYPNIDMSQLFRRSSTENS